MFLALSARNKFSFVNGLILKLDPSSPLFNSWSRCNTMVLSWLTNSLSMELKASVMYINTAKDLWIDLKDKLSQGNTSRLFELQKEISHLSQGSPSVSFISQSSKPLGVNFPIINLSQFALVDPSLLNWMLNTRSMYFIF